MRSVAPIDAPMNTFARINLLDRLPALVAVDLEVCPQTSRIRAIGGGADREGSAAKLEGRQSPLGRRAAGALSRRRGAGRGAQSRPVRSRPSRGGGARVLAGASVLHRQPVAIGARLAGAEDPAPQEDIPRRPVGRGSSQRSRRRCAGRHGADGRGALDAHRDLGSGRRPCRCAPWARARSRGVVKMVRSSPFCAIAPHPAMARATPPSRGSCAAGSARSAPTKSCNWARDGGDASLPFLLTRIASDRPGAGLSPWVRHRFPMAQGRARGGARPECAAIRGCAWCRRRGRQPGGAQALVPP